MAKAALAAASAHKCYFCDTRARGSLRGEPVEHYRPKSIYWWLTWSWENLLFSCYECNLDKGARFPLADGSTKLERGQHPPGDERPMLIDPTAEDPREHIEFRPVPGGKWLPMAKTERGRVTLELVCRTDRQYLLVDKWQAHVAAMRPAIDAIDRVMVTEDPRRIQSAWLEHTRRYRQWSAECVALSLDVLHRRFSAEIERWQLPLDVIYD